MGNEEIKHLELLSIFHYVVGGVLALFSCFPFIHVFMGLALVSGTFFEGSEGTAPPPFFGWMFVIIGTIAILTGWTLAICIIMAGKKLKARKSRIYCMVMAGIECMFTPFGTVLGVFTLIELSKDSTKALFE